MPITSLICPCTPGRLPLDHFRSGACRGRAGGQKLPMAWARRIVAGRLGDRYHADGRLTTTRILTCPREALFQDLKDVSFDVRSANSMEWGTAIHSHLETDPDEDQYVEIRFGGPGDTLPAARLFVGMIDGLMDEGVLICGKVDHITLGYGEIHDYKCHSENSQRFQASGKLDPTTAAQLNIYRLAIEQVVPAAAGKFETLIVYHGAMTSARGPEPWITAVQPMMTEQQILGVKPNGGDHTVREIIIAYRDFERRKAEGCPLDENLAQVLLGGRSMFGRKKCTDYCQPGVKMACDEAEGITTF